MDILIGTKNKFKIGEMEWIVGDNPEITIHYMEELIQQIKVEEDQPTLLKNAEKKATEISAITDWYVLTSDGGVDIPGLGEKWDILRNQRTVGEEKTDKEKVAVLLELMKDLKGDQRSCAYHFALALAKNGQVIWSKEEECERGVISEIAPKDEIPPYRWMGALWFYPQFQKTELELSEKQLEEVRQTRLSLKQDFQKATLLLKQSH